MPQKRTADEWLAGTGSNDGKLRHPPLKRAREIDAHPPLLVLQEALSNMQGPQHSQNTLHWFRSKDLRIKDNKALAAASKQASKGNGVLLACFLFSPEDLNWHGSSPARTDFMLESLRIVQDQLREKRIPLVVLAAPHRGAQIDVILDFIKANNVTHVFGNYELEVDELLRDIRVAEELDGVSFQLLHDQTVVEPGALKGASGSPFKVFTPYHKAWVQELVQNPRLLDLVDPPAANDQAKAKEYKHLFGSPIPLLPDALSFPSEAERDRLRKLWPPGHAAALSRLQEFLQSKIQDYKKDRSDPAKDCTSRLSPYLSAGVVSVRELLAITKAHNDQRDDFNSGDEGVAAWVRELVFREFYKSMLAGAPHRAMNLPNNLKFDLVQWLDGDPDAERCYKLWEEGSTGFPFVDAGMRQLNHEFYMHNRLRMNASSFLSANVLVDYRRGERYFVEHLIDWDLANNTAGWEPSYTVFNPVVQAEKCDPSGDYIRRWVPELKDVQGKAIFAPYDRLGKEEFDQLGYPKPCLDFKATAARAKEVYKRDIHSSELEE